MTVREMLNNCRNALVEIAAIERQIDRLMSTGAPSSGSAGGIRREKVKGRDEYTAAAAGTNHPEAAREQAVDGYIAMLERKKEQLEGLLNDVERVLDELADGRARAVLRLYYGVGWSDAQIAEEMDTERQVVQRWRSHAIEYLEITQKNVPRR